MSESCLDDDAQQKMLKRNKKLYYTDSGRAAMWLSVFKFGSFSFHFEK